MIDFGPDLTTTGAGQGGKSGTAADAPMRGVTRLTLAAAALAGVALVALFVGFVSFAGSVVDARLPSDPRAEGIVVLTGGTARIDAALGLLAEGRASRLLISGVNPAVTRDTLARNYGAAFGGVIGCCVDLGRDARDTIGNAAETKSWAEQRRFASLLVVTSDYHMARSMAELADAMPGVDLTPVPIATPELALSQWWRDPAAASLLAREYAKYILTVARLALQPPPSSVTGAGVEDDRGR